MSKCQPATKAELEWCKRLEKVLKAHPKGLWLFAGDGCLHVMKTPEDGDVHGDGITGNKEGVEDDNRIAMYLPHIIIADGGGW